MPLELLLPPDQIGSRFEAAPTSAKSATPSETARATLQGLRWAWAGLIREDSEEFLIPGEIRRLELLLWDLECLADFDFRFVQAYDYDGDAHRVVARSWLRAPVANFRPDTGLLAVPEPPPPFLDALAVHLGHVAELQGGYLLLPFADAIEGDGVRQQLWREHGIDCVVLDYAEHPGGGLLRTRTTADATALLALVRARLQTMPGVWQRFHCDTPVATVTKELIFDSAHFITDHPAKRSNLHGGRYLLQVQVSGRVDPVTGCVVDYGYLKRVVNRRVVERFDHHTLNYAATELAWRSSTEMLCVFVWEQLIDYLPGMTGLRLYETTQSWCDYRGPTLAEHLANGSDALLHPLDHLDVESRRRVLGAIPIPRLRRVGLCV
ncbi:MAG: 6-carboxytetrahydropterin synthase [Thiohalocapsa sp.]